MLMQDFKRLPVGIGQSQALFCNDHVGHINGGLNRPLQDLATPGSSLENPGNGQLIQPFQTFDDAFSIVSLLEGCRTHHTASALLHYSTHDRVSDLISRCIARGLDAKWALEGDLANLVFGKVLDEPIP